jgi:hypothetical protein
MPSVSSQLILICLLIFIAPWLEQWIFQEGGGWLRPFVVWLFAILLAALVTITDKGVSDE